MKLRINIFTFKLGIILISFIFSSHLFYSCNKDIVPDKVDDLHTTLIDHAKRYHDSISNFKPSLLSIDTGDIFSYLDLDWNQSTIELSNHGNLYVKVPVIIDNCLYKDSIYADYIFYNDTCGLTSEIWFYGYDNTFTGVRKDSIYDGWVIVMNSCYWTSQVFVVENGSVILRDTIEIVQDDSNSGTTGLNKIDPRKYKPKKIKCPTFDGNGGGGGIFGWLGNIFSNIGDFFGKLFSGGKGKKGGPGGNGNNGRGGWSVGWSGFGGWWSGTNGSGGYGGGTPGPNWSEEETIDHNRYVTASKILQCLEENDGTFSNIKQILINIIGNCKSIPTSDFDNLTRQLMRQDGGTWLMTIRTFLLYHDVSEYCLKTMYDAINCTNNATSEFVNDQSAFLQKFGTLDMDEDEFIAFVREHGCEKLHGIQFDKCLVRAHIEKICPQISEVEMNKILTFLMLNPEALDYSENFAERYCTDNTYKWDRWQELFNLVDDDDPFSLLANCNGDKPNSFWHDLYNLKPSNNILDKLKSLNYNVQDIEDASGEAMNLDYFSVKITQMPTYSGSVMTAEELVDHIRRDMNHFVNGVTFEPINSDYNLWNSTDPTGAIITITMTDDGTVVTSDYQPEFWVFTTVDAPFALDGTHPVSGNRQFGYIIENGNVIIFTKGADRLTKWYHGLAQSIAFAAADALWNSFTSKIYNFVQNHSGSAIILSAQKNRPKWSEIDLKLKTNTPITHIPCD